MKPTKTPTPPKVAKKNMSFNLSLETIEELKELAEKETRTMTLELEFLINNRWNELQVIELNRGMKPKGDN